MWLVWRLARAWDLNEEKTLDLIFLTLIGAIVGARVYFAILNVQLFFPSLINLVLINKVPGFSFWGGLLGGWLSLYYFSKRMRQNFWQLADIAVVGLLGGLMLAQVGCFLGGCSIGAPSDHFFAVTQIGYIGKRWPVQIIEALLLFVCLRRIWSKATHFHQRGEVASRTLIYIGIIKMILEPFRQDHSQALFPVVLLFLGIFLYYKSTRLSPLLQLKKLRKLLANLVFHSEARKELLQKFIKNWYNQLITLTWGFKNFKKSLRRLNVRFSRKNT